MLNKITSSVPMPKKQNFSFNLLVLFEAKISVYLEKNALQLKLCKIFWDFSQIIFCRKLQTFAEKEFRF
jgi:hypothetical protein